MKSEIGQTARVVRAPFLCFFLSSVAGFHRARVMSEENIACLRSTLSSHKY